jgi:hypothetical protein
VQTYNREQWIESFEGQLLILRPHLRERVLGAMSNSAWQQHGTEDEGPIEAAKAWSASLDRPSSGVRR